VDEHTSFEFADMLEPRDILQERTKHGGIVVDNRNSPRILVYGSLYALKHISYRLSTEWEIQKVDRPCWNSPRSRHPGIGLRSVFAFLEGA
jgi:hypothetical protein